MSADGHRGIDYGGPYMQTDNAAYPFRLFGDLTPMARALQAIAENEGDMAKAAKHSEFSIQTLIDAKERAMAATPHTGPFFMPSEVEGPLTPSTYKHSHNPAALLKARLNHGFRSA